MKEKWENIYGNIKCGPKNKTGICLSYADYSENPWLVAAFEPNNPVCFLNTHKVKHIHTN